MSRKQIEVRDTPDGAIEIIMRGKAAASFAGMAAREGISVEKLGDAIVRKATERGRL